MTVFQNCIVFPSCVFLSLAGERFALECEFLQVRNMRYVPPVCQCYLKLCLPLPHEKVGPRGKATVQG